MVVKGKVLVVEDDFDTRKIVGAMLESKGYDPVLAEDGHDAVRILEDENSPDEFLAICLDVFMPGLDGFDVLVRLKTHADTQNIPVIMLTAADQYDSMLRGYELGAAYYITKPFTLDQVMYGIDLVVNQQSMQ